ncbi:MAG TPA: sugar phosphate nucleotidyltransferase [Thermotogota bacterium]|nr:sugar phosphate nucleotidyltransferase [Thermotogota bacterium]
MRIAFNGLMVCFVVELLCVKIKKEVTYMQVMILAGGSGERFWPLSTSKTPKQFLKLFGEKSLIRHTYERLTGEVTPEDIYVVTSLQTREQTIQEIPEIPEENIIGEPLRKNTAAACFTGSLLAKDTSPILVLPADHKIREKERFWTYIRKAEQFVKKHEGLITFGIHPTRPETGYGYIETGEEVEASVYTVLKFHEKPELSLAEKYIEMGNYYWNSGMFLWSKAFFLKQMLAYAPDVYNALIGMNPLDSEELTMHYEQVPAISIDYALMERSSHVQTMPISLDWSDLGSWEAIKELAGPSNNSENICLVDSDNVYVRSETGKKIAIIGGCDGLIVVETNEGILICQEKSSQKVREAAKKFNNPNASEGLLKK